MEEGDWTTQNGAQTRHTFEIIGLVGFYCLVLASSLNSMFLLLPVFCSQSPCCHRDRLIFIHDPNEDRERLCPLMKLTVPKNAQAPDRPGGQVERILVLDRVLRRDSCLLYLGMLMLDCAAAGAEHQ
jgi:hypothetical protein